MRIRSYAQLNHVKATIPTPQEHREPSHNSRTSVGTPSAVAVEGSCHSSRTSCSSPRSTTDTTDESESVTSSDVSSDSFTTAVRRCHSIKLEDKENRERLDVNLVPSGKLEFSSQRRNIKPFQNSAYHRNHPSLSIKKANSEDLSAVEFMSTSESLRLANK